ncbi:unnamed protein product [Rhizoctonia solani]|uniref:Uncharacterized protein n=1 Tax=Rhizoctonia solani TaxID=456999 RepID=A0A8H2XHX7_9AGAM|nr:unnamed protein product [Rhizoctonia solani]
MESRRQYYEPVHNTRTPSQYIPYGPTSPPAVVHSNHCEDVPMAPPPPVEAPHDQNIQQHPPPYIRDLFSTDSSLSPPPEEEVVAPVIEFSTQWNNRREAQWDIIGPKRNGTRQSLSTSTALAQGAPQMWAENIYDAQDALPYFSASQTMLASKVPRAVARSVLLTRNLHDIDADWSTGTIKFTVQTRYKLQLNRPKKWKPPSQPGKLVNIDCKPMDPIQFRKLKGCYDAGVPVRVLATGDFPSLPIFQHATPSKTGLACSLGSDHWQNGELEHLFENTDLETGKCSGRSKWEFEFKSCNSNEDPQPWWCPLGESSQNDSNHGVEYDCDAPESRNAYKRRRVDARTNPANWGHALISNVALPDEKDDKLGTNLIQNYRWIDDSVIDPEILEASCSDAVSTTGHTTPAMVPLEYQRCSSQFSGAPDHLLNAVDVVAPVMADHMEIDRATCSLSPPEIHPDHLGLSLNPLDWIEDCLWHRRAHTEAAGPVGTLFRLDDGGHQAKTGLHQMAVRDEKTGLTFVEYWLAEAPMPILAELKRAGSVNRRNTRGKTGLPKMDEVPQPDTTSLAVPLTPGPGPSTLDSGAPLPNLPPAAPQAMVQTPNSASGTHPDGGPLIRQRDPGGSRAILSKDTPDRVFSGFATDVAMERQENSTTYKAGISALSCHYTYLAGSGTHIMHTSSVATDWEHVPDCVYDAHTLLVDRQAHTVFSGNDTIREFNQSIYILGNGATGTNTFRITHKAEEGPIGYMVFGASCSIEILVGNGENIKRTTKGGAARRAEMLLAHGDALMTMPLEGDPPLEVRVKRTGLAIVAIARYVTPEHTDPESTQVAPQKERLPLIKKPLAEAKRDITPAKRKARATSAKY